MHIQEKISLFVQKYSVQMVMLSILLFSMRVCIYILVIFTFSFVVKKRPIIFYMTWTRYGSEWQRWYTQHAWQPDTTAPGPGSQPDNTWLPPCSCRRHPWIFPDAGNWYCAQSFDSYKSRQWSDACHAGCAHSSAASGNCFTQDCEYSTTVPFPDIVSSGIQQQITTPVMVSGTPQTQQVTAPPILLSVPGGLNRQQIATVIQQSQPTLGGKVLPTLPVRFPSFHFFFLYTVYITCQFSIYLVFCHSHVKVVDWIMLVLQI